MSQRQQIIALKGGLDLVTPAMMKDPGSVVAGINYESEARGYVRGMGYERMDGRPAPSEALYHALYFVAGNAAIAGGITVTGQTSGATGVTLSPGVVTSGVYGSSNAAGYLLLYPVTGTFIAAENLLVSGVARAVASGTAILNGAPSDAENSAALALVRAARRTAILAPPGSGPIRGVEHYRGSVYAWRDNVGATAGVMYKATTSGWVAQSFGKQLLFDAGITNFTEGATLTGATSGATGTIVRAIQYAGIFDVAPDNTAYGIIILSGGSGTFVDNETITGGGGSAKANGASSTVTLPAGATIRGIEENFYANEGGACLYFTTNTGRAFEYDGTHLAPVRTGLSDALDKPQHIAVHRNHLFLSFPGGLIAGSSTGEPLIFDAVRGAVEFGFGQDVTGMKSNTKDSLIITGRNKLGYLIGADITEYDLKSISESSGAVEGSLEVVGSPIFLDDQGVRDMQAAEAYGDWTIGTITQRIEPLIAAKRQQGIGVAGALRVRAKDQYRLYFKDQTAISIYFGRQPAECMVLSLGFQPTCFSSGEDANGNEILVAGGADGMVYQLDRGTSFDGAPIEAFMRLAFSHQGAPNMEKRYHRARLEGQAGLNNTALSMVADFSYGSDQQPPARESAFMMYGAGGFWNEAVWGTFNWSSAVEGQAFAELDGIGENVSVAIMSDSATELPHSLSTLTVNFTPRRRIR